MANAWKRDNSNTQKLLSPKTLLSLLLLSLFLYLFFSFLSPKNPTFIPSTPSYETQKPASNFPIPPFNCQNSPQSHPIVANTVENLKYPFIYSLADLGSLPDKPHKNIVRLLKGKPFRRPDISATIQDFLEGKNKDGLVVDVGANVGMASFAAALMGFKVLAFEPVLENLQRICDGVWFNRIEELITVFEAAASDRNGNITFHKIIQWIKRICLLEEKMKMFNIMRRFSQIIRQERLTTLNRSTQRRAIQCGPS
ncbi:hypothetical protein DITRI_Ditri03aG0079700 [Diplodiscus trichospermus]